MDVAAVRSDGLTDSPGDAPTVQPSYGLPLLIATAVVLAALVAAAVLLGIRDHHHRQLAAVRQTIPVAQQGALSAARAESIALTTISYRTATRDVDRVLAGATGGLRKQFASEASQLPATLAKTKSVSKGAVLSAALSSLGAVRAQVLVAIDATVSGTDTGASGVLKHYRMVVTLEQVNGKWLASQVGFAGAPQ